MFVSMMCRANGASRRDMFLACGTELRSHESAEARIFTLDVCVISKEVSAWNSTPTR